MFQLLSTEGVTRCLGGVGAHAPWVDALELLARGEMRERILDTVWAGLVADWRPVDQRPLLELLRRSEPSDDELVERLPGLLRMTSSDNATVVVWALKQLTGLLAQGRLDATSLLLVRAPLTMKGTATANAHLALLEKAIRAGIGDPVVIAGTSALALDHPHDTIRARAGRLVTKHAPAQVRPSATTVPVVAEPLVRPSTPAFEVLPDEAHFVSQIIASLAQELSGIELEQLIEATPRFGPTLSDKARTAIAQGRRQQLGRGPSTFRSWLLAEAVVAEIGSEGPIPPGVRGVGFESFDVLHYSEALAQRANHVAWSMKHPGVVTGIATPSTTDGVITLEDLRERLSWTEGRPTLQVEITAAALRLAPSDYDAAESLRDTEAGRALLHYVLRIQEQDPEWTIHPFTPIASGYPQAGWGMGVYDAAQDESARPAGEPDVLAALLDRRELVSTRRGAREAYEYFHEATSQTHFLSMTLPHHREHYASHVLSALNAGPSLDYEPRQVDGSILRLGTGQGRTGPATVAALASATTLQRAENKAATVDALVERGTFGELDGAALGRAMRDQIERHDVVPRRMSTALAEAGAALGPLASPIADALCELLPMLGHMSDGHAFASTLADLSGSLGRTVQLPDDLAELNNSRASTALARAVKRIRTT